MSTNLPAEQIVIAALHEVMERGHEVAPGACVWGVEPTPTAWEPTGDPICAIGAVLLVMQPHADHRSKLAAAAGAVGATIHWIYGVSCGFEANDPTHFGIASPDAQAGHAFGLRLRAMIPGMRSRHAVTPA